MFLLSPEAGMGPGDLHIPVFRKNAVGFSERGKTGPTKELLAVLAAFRHCDSGILAAHKAEQNQRKQSVLQLADSKSQFGGNRTVSRQSRAVNTL
jgi:hypothetical protein